MIFLIEYIIIAAIAIIVAVINVYKTVKLFVLALGLVGFVLKLFTISKEKENSKEDSEILIKELEKRVEAVNLWDK